MRILYDDMKKEFERVLLKKGFNKKFAKIGAEIITDNSCDGVYSHGLNRFSTIVNSIDEGEIKPNVVPIKVNSIGAIEQWDGNFGFGPINAFISMDRAIELAAQYGIGCVAVSNTNHWLRGGTYGIKAANKGCIGICMTNTLPNMPPWGGCEYRIGNNPFIITIPKKDGKHVILDMAQSQFSFGKLQTYSLAKKKLPVAGGYDKEGNITNDPDLILNDGQVLQAGFWKGSGFSIAIDMLVSSLSMGNSTANMEGDNKEKGISQVFIAIDPRKYAGENYADKYIEHMSNYIKSSKKINGFNDIFYPGERAFKERKENLKNGIPVNEDIWKKIISI